MSSISHGAPQKRRIIPLIGLWLAIIAGIIITLLPVGDTPSWTKYDRHSGVCHCVWISEAMDYTASAIVVSHQFIAHGWFLLDTESPDDHQRRESC